MSHVITRKILKKKIHWHRSTPFILFFQFLNCKIEHIFWIFNLFTCLNFRVFHIFKVSYCPNFLYLKKNLYFQRLWNFSTFWNCNYTVPLLTYRARFYRLSISEFSSFWSISFGSSAPTWVPPVHEKNVVRWAKSKARAGVPFDQGK